MADKTYKPTPIDTSDVSLPIELSALVERLAENAHDVWAAGRMAEGWRFGCARDDLTKRHPCLVPYRDLAESEKDYDRRMTVESLKAIVALGYRIAAPQKPHRH